MSPMKTFFGIEWRYDTIFLTLAMMLIIIVCTRQITTKLESLNKRTVETLQQQTITMEKAVSTESVIVDRLGDLERRELLVEAQAQVNNDRIKDILDEEAVSKRRLIKKKELPE